jgi:hypothetical protein
MSSRFRADGLLRSSPATIFTYGGGTIEPLSPDPADIDIRAVAHSLSQQCRWTGHTSRFYSVAEHCVLASRFEKTLDCLLHDASEAYLSDLARPVKHAAGLGDVYRECEFALEQAIAVRFNLQPPPMSAAVKAADDAMLRREAQELIPHLGSIYAAPPKGTPHTHCWSPQAAEAFFLERFNELGGTVE